MKNNNTTIWRKVKLGTLGLDISDGNYSSKYPKKSDFVKAGVPFIRADNIKDGRVVWSDMKYISREKHQELQKGHLKKNDVLITTRGEIGRIARVGDEFIDSNINAQIVRINTKGILDQRYFFYFLLGKSRKGYFQSIQTGTALQQLPIGQLRLVDLEFPENLTDQKRIADILSAFDDKIELNNKISRTLEAMAQAIFKEWFVKFRFPGHEKVKMVDSELGKIPEKWKVKPLGELAQIRYGKDLPTRYLTKTGFPVYGGNGVIGFSEKYLFDVPKIIVGCRGAFSGNIFRTENKSFVTHNSLIVDSDILKINFLFYCLKNRNVKSTVTGSAQPQITINELNQLEIILPELAMIKNFEETASNLNNKIDQIEKENQKLSALRDLLLPKLMSGEIRV